MQSKCREGNMAVKPQKKSFLSHAAHRAGSERPSIQASLFYLAASSPSQSVILAIIRASG
jgi:hypothetical protein